MGSHRLAGAWTQFKEQAKQHWGELPDGGFYEVERRRDSLARLIQERYGIERDEAIPAAWFPKGGANVGLGRAERDLPVASLLFINEARKLVVAFVRGFEQITG